MLLAFIKSKNYRTIQTLLHGISLLINIKSYPVKAVDSIKQSPVKRSPFLCCVVEFFFMHLTSFKGILSTKIVIFSYPKLLSFSVLTFIK